MTIVQLFNEPSNSWNKYRRCTLRSINTVPSIPTHVPMSCSNRFKVDWTTVQQHRMAPVRPKRKKPEKQLKRNMETCRTASGTEISKSLNYSSMIDSRSQSSSVVECSVELSISKSSHHHRPLTSNIQLDPTSFGKVQHHCAGSYNANFRLTGSHGRSIDSIHSTTVVPLHSGKCSQPRYGRASR